MVMWCRPRRRLDGSDRGVTLVELVVALFITAILGLGVAQINHLGINSLLYASAKSLQTHSASIVARNFTSDVSASNGMVISAPTVPSSAANLCTTWNASDTTFTKVKPLLTITSVSGSQYVGYEVRLDTASNTGQLWRVKCATTGTLSNPLGSLLLRTGLPVPSDSIWLSSMACTGLLLTVGTVSTAGCPNQSFLITTIPTFATNVASVNSATSITVDDASSISVGVAVTSYITRNGSPVVPAGTTVLTVDTVTNTVTFSQSTTLQVGDQLTFGGKFVTNGTAAQSSSSVVVASSQNLLQGMWVTGTGISPLGLSVTASSGIPAGDTVANYDATNKIVTLASATTSALSNATVTIGSYSTTATNITDATTIPSVVSGSPTKYLLLSNAGGIPLTTVAGINGTTLTLSAPTTQALSNTPLSFTAPSGLQFTVPPTTTSGTPCLTAQDVLSCGQTIIAARSAS